MGDRAVAGFREKSGEPTIFIYSHWGGSDQTTIFANALEAAMPRIGMGDASYATRIMVSHIVGDEWQSETGWGLYVGGTRHGADYAYILIADFERKMVLVADNDDSDNIVGEIPMDEFIANHHVLVADATLDIEQEKAQEFLTKHPELEALVS